MTVKGKIGNVPVNFLVDTEAGCTAISDAIFNKLCDKAEDDQLGDLTDTKFQIAGSTSLPTPEKLKVNIQLGPVVVLHEVSVGSICDEGIIGYDFLKTYGCVLDIDRGELQFNGKMLPSDTVEGNSLENREVLENAEPEADSLDSNCLTEIPFEDNILKIKENVHIVPENEQLTENTQSEELSKLHTPVTGNFNHASLGPSDGLIENDLDSLTLEDLPVHLQELNTKSASATNDFDSQLDLHHIQRLQKIKEAGLKLKPSKCEFFKSSLAFLGHRVTAEALTADRSKVRKWSIPKMVRLKT